MAARRRGARDDADKPDEGDEADEVKDFVERDEDDLLAAHDPRDARRLREDDAGDAMPAGRSVRDADSGDATRRAGARAPSAADSDAPDAPDPLPPRVRKPRPPSRWESLSSRTRTWLAASVAALLALLLRLPAQSLPIEGDAVAYGALARSIAHGDGYTIDAAPHDRYPPGWPALVAIPVALGATVTGAIRETAWLLGALAAALVVLLGARWSRGRASFALLVLVAAAHPDFALFAGGLVPGSEALALVIVLSIAMLAGGERPAARWGTLALAGVLPLVRYDALPFSIAAALLAVPRGGTKRGALQWAFSFAVVLLPIALWAGRTWIASGVPWGRGYAGHGLSFGRIPTNLLVLAGILIPVAGLGLLLPFLPRGVAAVSGGGDRDQRRVVRTLLLAAVAHLALVVVFAGPTGAGERSLRFLSTGSLRFGLLAVPFVVIAGLAGLSSEKEKIRRIFGVAIAATVLPLALYLVSGGLQRTLPVGPRAAARLHALATAYDAAIAEAGSNDAIGLDLLPRDNEGVEVFLGDRAPGRVTGVFVRSPFVSRPGLFPSEPVLPLDRVLPRGAQVVVVTDVPREGVVFTGDREFLVGGATRRVGGPGIFARATLRQVDGGRAGSYRVESVRRPGR